MLVAVKCITFWSSNWELAEGPSASFLQSCSCSEDVEPCQFALGWERPTGYAYQPCQSSPPILYRKTSKTNFFLLHVHPQPIHRPCSVNSSALTVSYPGRSDSSLCPQHLPSDWDTVWALLTCPGKRRTTANYCLCWTFFSRNLEWRWSALFADRAACWCTISSSPLFVCAWRLK